MGELFRKMSKASEDENFDENYPKKNDGKGYGKFKNAVYEHHVPGNKFTNCREIYNVGLLAKMSNGKAPDELLLTAEHLKNGDQTILVILEHLFNSIYMKMDMFRIFLRRVL